MHYGGHKWISWKDKQQQQKQQQKNNQNKQPNISVNVLSVWVCTVKESHQWPLLLTWINFNPSMDK